MKLDVNIGLLPVRVVCEACAPRLVEFFQAFPQSKQAPKLTVMFVDRLDNAPTTVPSFSIVGAHIRLDSLRYTDYASPAGYQLVKNGDGYSLTITTQDVSRLGWRSRLQLWQPFSPFYLDAGQRSLSAFIYGVWQYLAECLMTQCGSSLIHASCVARDGQAILFPAWGGVGKTSLMYQMVMYGGWQFIADDFSILTQDGNVYFNPSPIAVYPYNLKGLPEIQARVMRQQDWLSRLQWSVGKRIRGNDGVGRRIAPIDLFGADKLAAQATLRRVIYLQRWDQANFELKPTLPAELAARATSVLLAELRQFRYEFQAWNSIPGFSLFPKIWEVAQATQTIFAQAFQRCELATLFIPQQALPADLYAFVSKHLKEQP